MTTRVCDCWCGAEGSEDLAVNYAGSKGRVVYFMPCSREHKEMFEADGDMVALFNGGVAVLKKFSKGINSDTERRMDEEKRRHDFYFGPIFVSVASPAETRMIELYNQYFGCGGSHCSFGW